LKGEEKGGGISGMDGFQKEKQALRAEWGIFIGTLLGTILKLGASGIMAYYFILAVV